MRQDLNIGEVEVWLETVEAQSQIQTHQSQPSRKASMSSMSENMSTDHQKGLATIKPLETKSGWQRWNEDINNALLFAGFNDVLNRQPDKPTRREAESSAKYSERVEAWEDKQARALAAARDRCGHNAKNAMKDCETIVDALAAIKEQFQPSGSGGYDRLTTEFNGLDLAKCASVGEFGSEILRVWDQIKGIDPLALGESYVVQHFLNGLGERYDSFRTSFSMQYSVVATKLKPLATLAVSIEAAEDHEFKHFTEQQMPSTNHVFYNKHNQGSAPRQKRKVCGHCGRLHGETCWYLDDTKAPESFKKQRELQSRLFGHEAKRQRPDDVGIAVMGAARERTSGGQYNIAVSLDDKHPDSQLRYNGLRDAWILDTGATGHLTARNDAFVPGTYKNTKGLISTGIGGSSVSPIGQGTVRLQCATVDGPRWLEVPDVQYAPNAGVNLLSLNNMWPYIDTIRELPTGLAFTKGDYRFTASIRENLLLLDTTEVLQFAGASYSVKQVDRLWHERMGHLSEASLAQLRKLADGMDAAEPDGTHLCEDCVKGRMRERPHDGKIKPGSYPMEAIHADIAELPVLGFDGSRYAVTMLDDFTEWAELMPIRQKSEFFEQVRYFVEHNETPTRRCKRIRLDRAGENQARSLKAWAESKAIELEYTDTEQHQANGRAERLNRTMSNKLQSTMQSANISERYWPLVLPHHSVYVRNRSPCSKRITPFELFNNHRPNLSNIRTLGSKVFVLKGEKQRPKWLGSRVTEGTLLGFKGNHQYLVLFSDRTFTWRTNVVFEERLSSTSRLVPVGQDVPDERAEPRGEIPETQTPSPLTDFTQPELVVADDRASPDSDPTEVTAVEDHIGPAETPSPEQGEPGVRRSDTPDTRVDEHRRRRSSRTGRGRTSRYSDADWQVGLHYIMLASIMSEPYEPRTLREAKSSAQWPKWQQACEDEIRSLRLNKTWRLKRRASVTKDGKHVLRGKWVFKVKRGPDGRIQKYKARWVVKGFEQQEGCDYHETFAAVVKPMSYKALFAIAAALDYEIEQMDVKTAFLYGNVEEEVYVEQPTGYEEGDGTEDVCVLDKALYGLKQSPRIWYNTLTGFLQSLGFEPLDSDLSVFIRGQLVIAIYVDDILLVGPSSERIDEVKRSLHDRFSMTDLGPCNYYLGMTVRRDRVNRTVYLGQRAYIEKFLKEYDMWDVKPAATPMDKAPVPAPDDYDAPETLRTRYQRAVGALMYCMLGTRPDIAFAVSVVSRFSSNPTVAQWDSVVRIFRYLRATVDLELVFSDSLGPLTGFTDADWAGDHETRRSTSGYVFSIGSAAISWSSKRQPTVALSTCEAEYIGQTQATKEAVWLRSLLAEIARVGERSLPSTIIYSDNQGAIALAKNPQFHGRSKHIDIQHHYVREKIVDGTVELTYIDTSRQIADGLTKALPREPFERFRKALGLQTRV